MHVINMQLVIDAFGVHQNDYVDDHKGQVTKALTEELLYKHDNKPPPKLMQTNGTIRNVNCQLMLNIM